MEQYTLQHDLKVFGFQVKTFPDNIGEAFDKLVKTLPQGDNRPYYGISWCTNGDITYIAAALETFEGEGLKHGYQNYTIEKGEYVAETLMDWTSKTHCIKDVFEEIMKDGRADNTKPAIEVYKNMQEMVCMVKADQRKEVKREFDETMNKLIQKLSLVNQEQLNTVPFAGSWTAGQLAQHLIKSNSGFGQIINGPVKDTERAPDEMVEAIKRDFLDFNTKSESPQFVRPENIEYRKEDLLHSLESIKASIGQSIQTADLTQTCTAFELPVYGLLTRLEAIYFVIYHTKRHTHQLENITLNL